MNTKLKATIIGKSLYAPGKVNVCTQKVLLALLNVHHSNQSVILSKMSKQTLTFNIPKYDPDLLAEYKKEFDRADSNSDGFLLKDEFLKYLSNQGQTKEMARITYKIVDINRDRKISFEEFADYIHSACQIELNNDVTSYLRLVFRSCDRKKTGYLDKKGFLKFMKYMNLPVGFTQKNKKFKQFDTDKDGKISFEELVALYNYEIEKAK